MDDIFVSGADNMNVILDCMTFNTFKDALEFAKNSGTIGQMIAVTTHQLKFRDRYPSLIAFDIDEHSEIYFIGEHYGERNLIKLNRGECYNERD